MDNIIENPSFYNLSELSDAEIDFEDVDYREYKCKDCYFFESDGFCNVLSDNEECADVYVKANDDACEHFMKRDKTED